MDVEIKKRSLRWVTEKQEILQIAIPLLYITIILEVGRCINLVLVNALKGASDARLPAIH